MTRTARSLVPDRTGARRVLVTRGGAGAQAALAWAVATLRPQDELVRTAGADVDLVVVPHAPGTALPRTRVARPTVVVPADWTADRDPSGAVVVCTGHRASLRTLAAALGEAERTGCGVVFVTPGTSGQPAKAQATSSAALIAQELVTLASRQGGSVDGVGAQDTVAAVTGVLRTRSAHVAMVVVDSGELHLTVPRHSVEVALDEAAIPVLLVPGATRRS